MLRALCRQDADSADASKLRRSGGMTCAAAGDRGPTHGAGPVATGMALAPAEQQGAANATQASALAAGQVASDKAGAGTLGGAVAGPAASSMTRTAIAPPPMQGVAPEDDDYDVE